MQPVKHCENTSLAYVLNCPGVNTPSFRVRLPLADPVGVLVCLLRLDAALVAIDAPAVLGLDDGLAAPNAGCGFAGLIICSWHCGEERRIPNAAPAGYLG